MFVEAFIDSKLAFKTVVSSKSWSPTWNQLASVIIRPYSSIYFKVVQAVKFGQNSLIGESKFDIYPFLKLNEGKGTSSRRTLTFSSVPCATHTLPVSKKGALRGSLVINFGPLEVDLQMFPPPSTVPPPSTSFLVS